MSGEKFRRRRLVATWAVSTTILFALCGLWSLATPIGAAPDEPDQIVKAASVVRAELVGPRAPGRYKAVTEVTVPQSFADDATVANCTAFHPKTPAGCDHGLRGSDRPTKATTIVGRYPPLYYAVVGLPTLAWHSDVAVYLMRLLGGLMVSLLLGLALAVASVWSRSRLLVAAVALSATPMAVFLGSVVNPSGMEIAAAICTWTAGLVLVLDRAQRPGVPLVVSAAGAAVVFVLSRGLSPFWLAIVALSLVALAPASVVLLARQRAVRAGAVVVGVVSMAGVAFIVAAQTLAIYPGGIKLPRTLSELGVIKRALGQSNALLHQFVGVFGWVDTPSPLEVTAGWLAMLAVLVFIGVVTSGRRQRGVVLGLLVLSVALPTAIMVSHARSDGIVWQARDGFPLYVGAVLVSGAVAGRRSSSDPADARWWTRWPAMAVVGAGVALCQAADFVWALRRYTVGLGSTANPFAKVPGGWAPPLSAEVLVALALIVAGVYGCWVARLALAPAASKQAPPLSASRSPPRSRRSPQPATRSPE
jgi:hypothetical protein